MTVLGFRPALWPTLIALPAVVLTFGLGVWQVQRLAWKEGLIAERTARIALPVLSGLPAAFAPDKHLFRRARFSGVFLHDREMYRPARSRRRGEIGVQVVTPLRLDGGGTILVNRGWVPDLRRNPETRRDGLVAGRVALVGVLRTPARAGWFVPDNDPAANAWFRLDLGQMAKHAGLAAVRPYYAELVADAPGGWPRGGQTRVTVRNAHLEYAITWFSLGLIGIVVYVLWHRRFRPADKNGADRSAADNRAA
ncbi:MAG: SURF1 family protein [Rhodospirillaceae bacterium]|nr:SURF1 family protein [Rhodospirillaceae bacterium]MYB14815.1 SURF1 family protein [Rhodospirillaceae bacterium]MYI48062.1 SURF1 family protein [Rhodospirillaceae bacterium]